MKKPFFLLFTLAITSLSSSSGKQPQIEITLPSTDSLVTVRDTTKKAILYFEDHATKRAVGVRNAEIQRQVSDCAIFLEGKGNFPQGNKEILPSLATAYWFYEDTSIRINNKEALEYEQTGRDNDLKFLWEWIQKSGLRNFNTVDWSLDSVSYYKAKFQSIYKTSAALKRLHTQEILCKRVEDDFLKRAEKENKPVTFVHIGGAHQRLMTIFRSAGFTVEPRFVYSTPDGNKNAAYEALVSYFILTDKEYYSVK